MNSRNQKGSIVVVLLILIVIVLLFILVKKEANDMVVLPPTNTNTEINTQTNNEILIHPKIEMAGKANMSDFVSFSIQPGDEVSGKVIATGTVQGGYFFEANVVINIVDTNKKLLRQGHGTATTDWMTVDPVSFTTTLDFTGLPVGPAFIAIQNDNASGLPENDKLLYIPIIIK